MTAGGSGVIVVNTDRFDIVTRDCHRDDEIYTAGKLKRVWEGCMPGFTYKIRTMQGAYCREMGKFGDIANVKIVNVSIEPEMTGRREGWEPSQTSKYGNK